MLTYHLHSRRRYPVRRIYTRTGALGNAKWHKIGRWCDYCGFVDDEHSLARRRRAILGLKDAPEPRRKRKRDAEAPGGEPIAVKGVWCVCGGLTRDNIPISIRGISRRLW